MEEVKEEVKPVVEKKEKKPLSEERKAKIKQYQATYKSKNKQKAKDYMNSYVEKSVAIECACGGTFRNYSKYKHVKTAKHTEFFAQMEKYALKQKEEELNKIKVEVINPLPLPPSLDFINVEQTGSLLKLSAKPKKEVKEKPKKERVNASKISIKEDMKDYVEAVKDILSQPVVVSCEADLEVKKTPKVTRIKKDKVVRIETPKTEIHNLVA